MDDHHRRMIRYCVDHLRFLEDQIGSLDDDIRQQIRHAGYERAGELLQSVPGVQEATAAALLAEMGIRHHVRRLGKLAIRVRTMPQLGPVGSRRKKRTGHSHPPAPNEGSLNV